FRNNLNQTLRGKISARSPLLGGSKRGIASSTIRIDILNLPGRLGTTAQRKMLEFTGESLRKRAEVLCFGHINEVGVHLQHHRCFHVSGMNAVLQVVIAIYAFRHSTAEPVDAYHHHVVTDAKLSRYDIHDTDLAAMAVKQRPLPDTACCHAGADLAPHANDRLSGERQCAGVKAVFIAFADGLRWQKKRVACFRQASDGFPDHAVNDSSINRQREMRAVLLNCADG